jgi:hypothetical protein
VSHPRIAAFARLADGNVNPVRAIEGQNTKISRTMHAIAMDPIRREIVVTNPFAEAVLFFRVDASGDEAPLRVIQGPRTFLKRPDVVYMDHINHEVYVPTRQGAILVFSQDDDGDVAPRRIIFGPNTKLSAAGAVAVDTTNNLLVVEGDREFLIFDRTADGDVAPKAVVRGPRTLFTGGGPNAMKLYPSAGVLVAGGSRQSGRTQGFVGIWKYDDTFRRGGDLPPKAIITGPRAQFRSIRDLILIPEHKEVVLSDWQSNTVFAFSLPEAFQ